MNHSPKVVSKAAAEIQAAALFFANAEKASLQKPGFDSRQCWATVADPKVGQTIGGPSGLKWLPLVVEWMLSIQDGTGQVERDLGTFTRLLDAHKGPLDEGGLTAEDLARLAFGLPKDISAVVNGVEGDLHLTPLSLQWQQQWVHDHGRRFCCYKRRKDIGEKRPQATGSARAVQRGRKAATAFLATSSMGSKLPSVVPGYTIQELGLASFKSEPEELLWNKKLAKFNRMTAGKVAANQQSKQNLQLKVKPYSRPERKTGSVFPAGVPAVHESLHVGLLVDACKTALEAEAFGTRLGYGKILRQNKFSGAALVKEWCKHNKVAIVLDAYRQLGRLGFISN